MFADVLSQSGLSLERLHSFCLVAEAEGVTRAAKGDPAKQSLYSRQVKDLEEFFGAELIRRKGRGIVLTSAGQRLHNMSREHFAALADLKAECQKQPLEIVVGAGESIIQWLILPRLAAIESKLPIARYKFLNLTSREIIRQLGDGLIDFGIMRKAELTRPLKGALLGRMGFSVFIPSAMQALVKGKQFPELLRTLPFAVLEGDGSFRQELSAIARKTNMQIHIKVECSSFPLVARSLACGIVAGILPSMGAGELQRLGIVEVPINALQGFEREICLAWNPRQLRIRTALEGARHVFQASLRF